ncbi:OmpP1/FadL family transporter [Aquirhabdus sp.]|uniref:OmpP1/FadL family transporter n=1 Tax=Aquirhabdus sp. TaxID=2824160 RepID=UPI00396CD078
MRIKSLSVALFLMVLPTTSLFAAAIDRSGQSIAAFLQPGNYAEAGFTVLDPTIEGTDSSRITATGDMANTYRFPVGAIKIQPFEQISFGLIFDEPFGADASYSGVNNFVTKPTDRVLGSLPITNESLNAGITGGTRVKLDSRNISAIIGYQPIKNFNFFGGAVYQEVKGQVELRGSAYSLFNGFSETLKESHAYGWLAGFAYQIPEIALKTSITYRSEIDHDIQGEEAVPLVNALQDPVNLAKLGGLINSLPKSVKGVLTNVIGINTNASGITRITTPQSLNLDFQMGLMKNTLAFANVRWVNWSSFAVRPYLFGQVASTVSPLLGKGGSTQGFNLVDYTKDQWSANLGVGRKFDPQFSGTAAVGWDSGAGNPVSTLGPTNGNWNVGLGLRYNPVPAWDVSLALKYLWLGNAEAHTGSYSVPGNESAAYAGSFSDNHAIAYGLKVGYHF